MTDHIADTRSNSTTAVILITVALIGLGLSLDYPGIVRGNFFSDCATYYALATSLGHDFDLQYSQQDIQRIYAEFSGGPGGLFLQRNPDNGNLYYGKSWVYPLVLAPAVRLLGSYGILVTHALLMGCLLWGMTTLWRRHWGDRMALLVALGFTLPTAITVYYFWIAPELFNLVVIFYGFFFLIYKEYNPREQDETPHGVRAFLLGNWTPLLGFALLGIATFSKISNGIFILPALGLVLLRLDWKRFLAGGVLFGLVAGSLFGIQLLATGHWNYQGGDRKSFQTEFPFANEKDFDNASPTEMKTNLGEYKILFYPVDLLHNIVYFFIGRYGGILPYYVSSVLALLFFLAAGRGSPHRWILFGGALLASLTYIVLIPTNVIGGGGTVGNRYFMNIMPVFFFLLPRALPRWFPRAAAVLGILFMGHILVNPLHFSRFPARYAQTPLLRTLPVEYTMLNDLPLNTENDRRRVPWYLVKNGEPARYTEGPHAGALIEDFYVYYLDDNAYVKEPNPNDWFVDPETGVLTRRLITERGTQQIWTKGEERAELILRTGKQRGKLQVKVTNAAVNNRVTLTVQDKTVVLDMKPRETRTVTVDLKPGYAYHYLSTSYLYEVIVTTSNGLAPRTLPGSGNDFRYLGAMLQFTFINGESE